MTCQHQHIRYGIWRSECQDCDYAWVGVANDPPCPPVDTSAAQEEADDDGEV